MSDADFQLDYLSRNADFQAGLDADEAEFRAVMMGSAALDEGVRDGRRTGEIEEELLGARDTWVERQEAEEELEGRIAEEVERRMLLLGNAYPFRWQGRGLSHRPSVTRVYEFCLAVTVAPTLTEGPLKGLPIAFERLARDVLRLYAGPMAQGIRTGWPRESADGLPTRAKALFQVLNDRTGEWLWHPRRTRPDDPSPTFEKDQGLDVVVWRPMPDRRIGQHFLLGQCACGTTDWDGKWNDLNLDRLGMWLNPATFSVPTRCFCIPFHVGNSAKLEEVSLGAGLTLDRARLALLAEGDADFISREAIRPYSEWIEVVANAKLHPSRSAPRKQKRKARW